MEKTGSSSKDLLQSWIQSGIFLTFSCLLCGVSLQSIFEQSQIASAFVSVPSWLWLVKNLFAGEVLSDEFGARFASVSFAYCFLFVGLFQASLIFTAAILLKFHSLMIASFVKRLAIWWLIFGGWGILWLAAWLGQFEFAQGIFQGTVVFWASVTLAGSLYELGCLTVLTKASRPILLIPNGPPSWKQHVPVFVGIAVFVGLFTAMNWGLWFNLRLPHGDSAMYEEHLWNFTHGKGFRSYLDQGLFWGEHIQFVHLFLIPIYWLCPSHLLLEFCESFALAIGAIPVYWMTYRSSRNQKAAVLFAIAYLFYFPLQFLDISIDLKTFRPISFGVPIVLFALDQIERKRFRSAAVLLAFSLTCKEDFSIIVFSIGFAMLARSSWQWLRSRREKNITVSEKNEFKIELIFGAALFIAGPAYLFFALKMIRSFRSGVEVHFAGYFSKFGKSPADIVWNMLTDPGLFFGELFGANALIYLLALLVPLGFLPLRSGWRCLSCAPMFVLLCLNELSQSPMHHFHAPLIPLIFWALATSLSSGISTNSQEEKGKEIEETCKGNSLFINTRYGWWVISSAFATSIWFTLTPLGIPFWDASSNWNGAKLYVTNQRAEMFSRIESLIPDSAKVASTDFIHPRYTHCKRSYDYSNYARRVSGGKVGVPDDTDYIVIDTRHPYSTIHLPEQVREYREAPEKWELLPDRTNGYFLVFKRKK